MRSCQAPSLVSAAREGAWCVDGCRSWLALLYIKGVAAWGEVACFVGHLGQTILKSAQRFCLFANKVVYLHDGQKKDSCRLTLHPVPSPIRPLACASIWAYVLSLWKKVWSQPPCLSTSVPVSLLASFTAEPRWLWQRAWPAKGRCSSVSQATCPVAYR